MKNRAKKIIGAISALAMVMGMVQTLSFAAVEADYSFNNRTDTLNAGDGGKLTSNGVEYTAVLDYAEGASGKAAGDYAYRMTYADLPYTVADTRGLEIPYYQNTVNSEGTVRTLEISIKYNEGTNYAHLRSYISANPSAWLWNTVVDFVSFKNGKVLVNNKDTGMAAKPNKWYRIAVEEHYNAADTRVYINGRVFDPGLGNYIFGNRWTQVLAGMDATGEAGTRDVSVTVDDVKIYTGAASITADNKVAYSGPSNITVKEGTTANDVLSQVNYNGAFVLASLNDTTAVASTEEVTDGSVVVLPAADGKTFGYVDVTVTPPVPAYKGEITKVSGTGDEANDVGFYGTFEGKGVVDQAFGIKVTLPDRGSHSFEHTGTITGDVTFGVILRGLTDTELAGAAAEYIR